MSQTDLADWTHHDTTDTSDGADAADADATTSEDWQRLTDRGAAYTTTTTPDTAPTPLEEPEQCCQTCGKQLPQKVRRVFGDNEDVCWECPHCPHTNRDGFAASANPAGTDRPTRDPRNGPDGGQRL